VPALPSFFLCWLSVESSLALDLLIAAFVINVVAVVVVDGLEHCVGLWR